MSEKALPQQYSANFISEELKKHQLDMSRWEKILISGSAYIGTGLGSSLIITDAMGFLISQFNVLSLSAFLTGVMATAGASVLVALLGIPIAYFCYQDMQDSLLLTEKIKKHEYKRNQMRLKLFNELFKLRKLCENDEEFKILLNKNIGYISQQDKNHFYHLITKEFKQKKKYREQDQENIISIETLNEDMPGIQSLSINRRGAIIYGFLQGLGITGVTFGGTWSVATLVASLGLALIPGVGWGIMALGCLAFGIGFGMGMYFNKRKNLQREQLKNAICKQKHELDAAQHECQNLLRKIERARLRDSLHHVTKIDDKVCEKKHSAIDHHYGLFPKKMVPDKKPSQNARIHLRRSSIS